MDNKSKTTLLVHLLKCYRPTTHVEFDLLWPFWRLRSTQSFCGIAIIWVKSIQYTTLVHYWFLLRQKKGNIGNTGNSPSSSQYIISQMRDCDHAYKCLPLSKVLVAFLSIPNMYPFNGCKPQTHCHILKVDHHSDIDIIFLQFWYWDQNTDLLFHFEISRISLAAVEKSGHDVMVICFHQCLYTINQSNHFQTILLHCIRWTWM